MKQDFAGYKFPEEKNLVMELVDNGPGPLVSLTAEVARTYVLIRTSEVLIDQARENAPGTVRTFGRAVSLL